MAREGTAEEETIAMLRARRALYGLLARLLLAPPDAALLAELRALPGFAEALPDPQPLAPDPRAALPDPRAAPLQTEYELIFGRNVYPYEALYVDRDLMLNTAATDEVARLYAECGFEVDGSAAGAPDHLGLELALMGYLLAVEIAARGAGDPAALAWALAQQGRCLHGHLARWAPICARAIQRVATHALYQIAAQLTLELILSDLDRAGPPTPSPWPPALNSLPPTDPWPLAPGPLSPTDSRLPAPGSLPPDDERGLNWVVRQLITPDGVGVFLSRGDLSALGRRLGLPVSIGERFQMLRGLFESAGQFEQVAPLLDALDGLFVAEAGALAQLAGDFPAWADGARPWLSRIAAGRALLGELGAQAGALPAEPEP